MKQTLRPRIALCVLGLVVFTGCTSLREIPRNQYAAQPERKNVRVMTRDSLRYEFDFINVQADTLVGYRRRDIEGPADEYATVRVPLDEVAQLSSRRLDWYRTGLVGGGFIAALVARGLAGSADKPITPGDGGGGGGSRVP
jgi:hypothetical protein